MPKIEGLQGVKGFFGEIALVSTQTLRVCSVVKNSIFSEIFSDERVKYAYIIANFRYGS